MNFGKSTYYKKLQRGIARAIYMWKEVRWKRDKPCDKMKNTN